MLGIPTGIEDYISPWLLDQQLRERKCNDYSSLSRWLFVNGKSLLAIGA